MYIFDGVENVKTPYMYLDLLAPGLKGGYIDLRVVLLFL